jgi:hypothetical protein
MQGPDDKTPTTTSAADWQREAEHGKPLNATPQGRLAIRLVTRGVMGCAFFAVGGALTSRWLDHYNPEAGLLSQKNPLSIISKIIDTTVGTPIAKVFGEEAVRFRPTNTTRMWKGKYGRGLGEEVSRVSFDFFCASIGDAWGRDIAGWIDPNVKKEWMKDGHIEWPAALKQALKSTWRYVSYNGGEDWAVAIPYVYFMKGHRALVEHSSPGFMYDFDRNVNGGSTRFAGMEHAGNYHMGGIADLQNRFVVYNMGTVAYRELYTFLGEKIKGKETSLYGPQDKEPPKTIGEKLGNVAKWAVRSVAKGAIYMTPSVPFFWITRTPQSAWRGLVVDADKGYLGIKKDGNFEAVTVGHNDPTADFHWAKYNKDTRQMEFTRVLPGEAHPLMHGAIDPHANPKGMAQRALAGIGRLTDKGRIPVSELGAKLDRFAISQSTIGKLSQQHIGANLKSLGNTYSMAVKSYTPYMYAKAEFANLWDDGKMDMALERAIDGASQLNIGEFRAGLREVLHAILHKPMPEAAREVEAQRRIKLDESAADVFTETKGTVHEKSHAASSHAKDGNTHRHKLSHRERLVARPKGEAVEVGAGRPKSFAEREEYKRMLEEVDPPTNSIN